MANELLNAAKKISKAIDRAGISSLNKALSAGQTYFQRSVRAGTGLTQKQIGSRVFSSKATSSQPSVYFAIGIQYGINAKYFKPQAIVVQGTDPRSGKIRDYQGVTIKVGNQPRYVLPNAWLAQVSNGELIPLVRKDLSITRRKPKNTRAIFLDVIETNARLAQQPSQATMTAKFAEVYDDQVTYFLSGIGGSTVSDT